MAALDSILNYVQLTPDVGTSGQPTAAQFADIAAAGYRVVINLAMHDSDGALPDEGARVSACGMVYLHLPVDFSRPTEADLRTFYGLMRTFEGQQVWVHCAMNLRVSAFMYRYLCDVRGMAPAAARSPMIDRWAPRMDDVWKTLLERPVAMNPAALVDERVLEHALLEVRPGQEAAYAEAFARARSAIESAPGFLGLRIERCMEQPNRHLLLVEWQRLEDHTEGFRGSAAYQQWRELLHPFYETFPTVQHYRPVDHPGWTHA